MPRSLRRTGALGACVAAAVALSGPFPASAAPAPPAAPAAPAAAAAETVFTLFAKEVPSGESGQTDQPPEVGDDFSFAGDLYRAKGGEKAGRDGVTCTVVRAGTAGGDLLCVGTFVLTGEPAGQLTGQALTAFTPTGQQPAAFDIAITGGTGDFKDARGFVRSTPDGDHERLEFRITN